MSKKKGNDNMQEQEVTSTMGRNALHQDILKRWQKKQKLTLSEDLKDILTLRFDGEVKFNEPLSKHTYIKIGGPADAYLKPRTIEALKFALELAGEHNVPYTILGKGANTLVKDGGVRGFVICLYDALSDYEVLEQTDDHIDLRVSAGMPWKKVMQIARDLGAADFAPLNGIPGSVGGLVAMNAGTPVAEIKDFVRSAQFLTKEGEVLELGRERLKFEYRDLKMPRTQFVLSVVFRLTQIKTPEEVEQEMKPYQEKRVNTQPLEYPNLGSVFKNPQPTHEKEVVATAGQLIEEAGLKNVRVGGARISPKHGNFIINEDNAKAKDVLTLINLAKDKIKNTTGIVLETEIKVIGEDPES
ncbi:MAG: UDP-N-acetylmuramate dehydrogenase [Deltaproteobacteria bacterium]|nr:UDP-N-acetylmuramate dehydrogenase [Deltaproteobacteria bacterium]